MVAAGCATLVQPQPSPAPTATSAPPPERPVAGGTPIGVSASGVSDSGRLAVAHVAALDRLASYTGTRTVTFRALGRNESGRIHRRVRVAESGERFASRRTVTGTIPAAADAPPPGMAFSNGSITVLPLRFGDDVEPVAWPAGESPLDGPPRVVDPQALQVLFAVVSTDVVGVDRASGTVVYRVRGGPGRLQSLDAWNVTVEARIARSGHVRSLRVRYNLGTPDRGWRVTRRVRYTDLNATTVPRPAWVDRAVANATTPVEDG